MSAVIVRIGYYCSRFLYAPRTDERLNRAMQAQKRAATGGRSLPTNVTLCCRIVEALPQNQEILDLLRQLPRALPPGIKPSPRFLSDITSDAVPRYRTVPSIRTCEV